MGAELSAGELRIRRAFRISAVALLAVIGLAGVVYLWPDRESLEPSAAAPEAPARIRETRIEPPAPDFLDVTASSGVGFVHRNGARGEKLLPETMGGGVAFLDFDRDGDQDLLFVDSGAWPGEAGVGEGSASLVLYANDGGGVFTDVSQAALPGLGVYGMGVAVGDYDGDGWRDIYLTAVGGNRLLRNLQGRFVDVSAETRTSGDPRAWSTGAAFLDYDRDGDLDLFVCNYVRWSPAIDRALDFRFAGIGRAYGPPRAYAGTHSTLFRNDGGEVFTDVSAASGVQVVNPATGEPMGKALAVRPLDFDGDGWLDLAVANDTVQNFLFRNLQGSGFREVGAELGFAFDRNGHATGAMGIDAGPLLDDGSLGVAIGNFANEMSSLYLLQPGALQFADEAIVSGLGPATRRALTFGLFFFDYDLDGRLDLLQANGHLENEINRVQASQHYRQPGQLFWNCGEDCARSFLEVPAAASGALGDPVVGRGAAFADMDGDGDQDVVITQVAGPPLVLRNRQRSAHHWLRLRLVGRAGNTDAIGARVVLTLEGRRLERMVMPTRSYLSQVELPLTFGLGQATSVDSATIHWPDGTLQKVTPPALNRLTVIRQHSS